MRGWWFLLVLVAIVVIHTAIECVRYALAARRERLGKWRRQQRETDLLTFPTKYRLGRVGKRAMLQQIRKRHQSHKEG